MNTPAGGVTLPELDRTAPERIWLQINPDGCASERDEPFPYGEEVTWCQDSVGGLQVEYVRADLARAALAGEWRDIASAPRDGRWLLIFCEGAGCPAIARWDDEVGMWMGACGDSFAKPQFWQTPPAAPLPKEPGR